MPSSIVSLKRGYGSDRPTAALRHRRHARHHRRRRTARDEPRAFEDVFGIADAFKGVDLAGRTDTSIVGDAFARQGMDVDPTQHGAFPRALPGVSSGRGAAARRWQARAARYCAAARCPGARRRQLPRAAHRQLRGCRCGEAGALRSLALLPLRRVRRGPRRPQPPRARRPAPRPSLWLAAGTSSRRTPSSSATRRATSPAPTPTARDALRWPPAATQWTRCAARAPTSSSRTSATPRPCFTPSHACDRQPQRHRDTKTHEVLLGFWSPRISVRLGVFVSL